MPSAIDWDRLRNNIVRAAVSAVNETLDRGYERALKDVPVRKVFRGGRQNVRFKTAEEVEADKGLRQRLGLAPEIVATPQAIAQVQAAGLNPKKGTRIRGEVFGFARTAKRPTETRGSKGPIDRRANAFKPGGLDLRQVAENTSANHLSDRAVERLLTSSGRRELATGRAIHQQMREVAIVDIKQGKVVVRETHFVPVGPPRLGGGLRSTVRVLPARAESFPVISGWLLAGDREHDYAKYQELGTRHNAAHPFLRPRLPEWRQELPRQLAWEFRRL